MAKKYKLNELLKELIERLKIRLDTDDTKEVFDFIDEII
jgi:hypothetical protein